MGNALVEIEDELINVLYLKRERECDINQCAIVAHHHVILDMVYTYFCELDPSDAEQYVSEFFITNNYKPQYRPFFVVEDIPILCEQLQITFLSSGFRKKKGGIERVISKENMVATGAVYTQNIIVKTIVNKTLDNTIINENIKILDFACGTGRFYCAIIDYLHENGLCKDVSIRKCVHAIDIDPTAINITRLKACSMISKISKECLSDIKENIRCGNALMERNTMNLFYQPKENILYDAIVSNPPYLVLKPSHNTSDELVESMKTQVQYYRTSGQYHYSIEGMLNLYQLSIERMLQLLKSKGELGVICPATLFADQSATKLRKFLLTRNNVYHITYFPEGENLFENNVTQATNIFYLHKDGQTSNITIDAKGVKCNMSISTIVELFPKNMEIPMMSEMDWSILKKISLMPKLKTLTHIRNKRGELDLTLNAQYVTSRPTNHILVRGKMITNTGVTREGADYVSEKFIEGKSTEYRLHDYGKVRLVGQNISNIDNAKRLRFAFCEPSDIIGNSCNYLSSDIDTLRKLHILFSSTLLNWRFKLTSSNNHINNYELDELPIINLDQIDDKITFNIQKELDEYVCDLYGLTKDETNYICNI